jgi:N-sulfoglucosamine sulfohydrolase
MNAMLHGFCFRLIGLLAFVTLLAPSVRASEEKPNILIITVDDMSADSIGAYGCPVQDTSPSIDEFAQSALRFNHAHVHVGNCMPGRNIMWSGLFSHVNGVEGFVQNREADYPVLCDLAQQAGYFAAIRGKVSHSTPYHPYAWDAVLDKSADGRAFHNKDPQSYGESTRRGIELARNADKPFCLLINISDPHKPFYSMGKGGKKFDDPFVPTRVFTADEVAVPGFLFEDDVVREELALYYSSVRRADDAFREVIKALEDSGQSGETFVMFLSDHGMPLPFAKTQLYHHSTHTPLMVRWPGVTTPASIDNDHMVSAIDFVPTLLDVMKHEHPTPGRLHGRSFEPLLRGESQSDRDFVILQYNENSGGFRHPMRGIQTRDYLYLYNPWSDGKRKFATATTGTATYRQMVKRAAEEADIAARLHLFDHRVVEEFYNVANDPDCLENLHGYTEHRARINQMRQKLAESLAAIHDPVAPLLIDVQDLAKRKEYMEREDARTDARRRSRQQRAAGGRNSSSGNRPSIRDAIRVETPKAVSLGNVCEVVIHHQLPRELGEQKLQVTLKTASTDPESKENKRIHREILTVSGDGKSVVRFNVPDKVAADAVRVAAFLGEDFQSNLQYFQSAAIPFAEP